MAKLMIAYFSINKYRQLSEHHQCIYLCKAKFPQMFSMFTHFYSFGSFILFQFLYVCVCVFFPVFAFTAVVAVVGCSSILNGEIRPSLWRLSVYLKPHSKPKIKQKENSFHKYGKPHHNFAHFLCRWLFSYS